MLLGAFQPPKPASGGPANVRSRVALEVAWVRLLVSVPQGFRVCVRTRIIQHRKGDLKVRAAQISEKASLLEQLVS
jgi:hypothetical protein